MRSDLKSISNTLHSVLNKYPAVQAAYLFGSYAEGRAAPDSDLDLALAGSRENLQKLKLDIISDLVTEGIDKVDLVLLDGADPLLCFEAVHHNCLVYARKDFDHGSYFSRCLREYFDLEPYLLIQRKAFKQRLLHGQA